jgi:hypothetical protein
MRFRQLDTVGFYIRDSSHHIADGAVFDVRRSDAALGCRGQLSFRAEKISDECGARYQITL